MKQSLPGKQKVRLVSQHYEYLCIADYLPCSTGGRRMIAANLPFIGALHECPEAERLVANDKR